MKWHKFDPSRWRMKLPKERSWVLLTFPPKRTETCIMPRSFALGYLRFGAGDRKSPYFVVPGIGGTPDAWSEISEELHALVTSAWVRFGASVRDMSAAREGR